jgi:hypothetical protein
VDGQSSKNSGSNSGTSVRTGNTSTTSGNVQDNRLDKRPVGRPPKDDEDVIDWRSTGRRRANAKLDKTQPCEWRGLINCGGGKHPIPGCEDGMQETAHHGPDKDYSNNAEDNVHYICSRCHNRWHAVNDKDYDATIHHMPIPFVILNTQVKLMMKHQPSRIKKLFEEVM